MRTGNVFIILVLLFVCISLFAQDATKEIAVAGEAKWQELISDLEAQGLFTEDTSAAVIVANFQKYMEKHMIFPKVDFNNTFTDINGTKYFYCEEPNFDGFVIEYNNQITEKLRRYSYVIGSLANEEWQLLGSIDDYYDWWGNVIFMKIKAIRIPNRVVAVVENGEINFVGEDIIDRELAAKAENPYADVPKNLTEIPKGLDPLIVAKLCYYLCIVEDNRTVWEALLSQDNFLGGKPETRVNSWWRTLKKNNRNYYYVRTAIDKETKKKYFFQMTIDGEDSGNPKPITVVLEDGEWKVDSVNP